MPPQAWLTHVAVPPTGSAQRVHETPHDFGSSELTQASAQTCSLGWQVGPEAASSPNPSFDVVGASPVFSLFPSADASRT